MAANTESAPLSPPSDRNRVAFHSVFSAVSHEVATRLTCFAGAAAVSAASAVAFFPSLRWKRGPRAAMLLVASVIILTTPFILPPGARFLRCLAAINAITYSLKLYDLHVGAGRGHAPGFPSFVAFLPNIFSLVHRKLDAEPPPTRAHEVHRLVTGVSLFVGLAALVVAVFRIEWADYGFPAEHTSKVIVFFAALFPLTSAAGAAWRLAGGRGMHFMNNPFAARTPADFWRRYNRPVHQFMEEDVFAPAGGRRAPFRATVAAFLVSALAHEYIFSAAAGRVQGYQTVFFLVQGIAVAATLRLRPKGAGAVAGVVATFAFNLATAVLFFASIDEVLPFYECETPVRTLFRRGGS